MHFCTLSRQTSWFPCGLHGCKAQGNYDSSGGFKLCLRLLFLCMLCFTFVKSSLMKASCQLQHMLCTKVLARIVLSHHLSDAAVNEGKQPTVAELHRGSRMRQQAARTEMQHMLVAIAVLTKMMMRRQIQGKGCVLYALKTEAIWCFKHAVICAHATSALLILIGVPSVEPEPEPSECIMLKCSVPVLCAEHRGVDVPSQMAVCVLCLTSFLLFSNCTTKTAQV